MGKSLSILVVAFFLLFGSSVIAADKVVIIPLRTCGDGLTTCSGKCVDTMNNPLFCGSCTPCGANSLCKQGVCFGGTGSTGDICTTHSECFSGKCLGGTCADDQNKIVFVSSELYNGNLGGLQGADAKCNKLANAAHLPGSYMAWLSDTDHSPLSRFNTQAAVPYVRVDGLKIQTGWSGLISGVLLSPISIDEFGNEVSSGMPLVWTNTNEFGEEYWASHYNCREWKSENAEGIAGVLSYTNATWTRAIPQSCYVTLHLYCVGQ